MPVKAQENGPYIIIPRISYWGKRAGGFYSPLRPKGANYEWGLIVKMKKWGAGSQNNGPTGKKNRWYQGRFGHRPKPAKKTSST